LDDLEVVFAVESLVAVVELTPALGSLLVLFAAESSAFFPQLESARADSSIKPTVMRR
jgi:hypothetical protein